jgi:hypothetical protein
MNHRLLGEGGGDESHYSRLGVEVTQLPT